MKRPVLSRRRFLAACAAAASPLFVRIASSRDGDDALPALIVFDSRIAASLSFAQRHRDAGVPCLDVATQDGQFWRALRRDLRIRPGMRVDGACRWSDWVNLRGEFAAKRLRVRGEQRLGDGSFAWSMA